MPLYEYRCDACDESFEVIERPNQAEKAKCPSCGAEGRKLISSFAVCGAGGGGPAGRGGAGCAGGG